MYAYPNGQTGLESYMVMYACMLMYAIMYAHSRLRVIPAVQVESIYGLHGPKSGSASGVGAQAQPYLLYHIRD